MNIPFHLTKKKFIYIFYGIIAILFIIRLAFPGVTNPYAEKEAKDTMANVKLDSIDIYRIWSDSILSLPRKDLKFEYNEDGSLKKHKIYSVPSFSRTFPDLNPVQLATAKRLGVKPVKNRKQAEKLKDKLVYIGSNPNFYVKKLYSSIPYLVPSAALLLEHIGRTFHDSLAMKDIPLSTIMVTSVLRTKDDVAKLQKRNSNATHESCHCYGTTFDISYNKYLTVQDPFALPVRPVRNDTLKWVLSEVLNDVRKQGLCYIKYERKQGCFHITVR